MAPGSKMATGSKNKQRRSGDDADADFKATKLPTINTAASKRKQRRSSVKDSIVEGTMDSDEEPAPKRAKTKKNEKDDEDDNNGMIRIIPPDEVKIQQIQVIIILSPPPVNHKRLAEQIQSMPEEIQELIRVQCVLTREDNVPFVRAFMESNDILLHKTQMKKAIEDREVVLGGKNFLADFKRLHPTVIRLAKHLKIVYITADISMTNAEWKKRQDNHDKLMEAYNKYQRLVASGLVLPQYGPEQPPAPVRGRHKMYPMGEPRFGTESGQVMKACRKFANIEHLTIDLSSHITYDGVDKGRFNTDHWYGERVGEHLYAAIGYNQRTGRLDDPAGKKWEKLQKLTLILGTEEVSKPEVPEDMFATKIGLGFRGPWDAPNWQWLRYVFRQPKKNNVVATYEPFVHTPFTQFKLDKVAGTVSYSREAKKGEQAKEA